MMDDKLIHLEVVYGTPIQQLLVAVSVPGGTTCAQAIAVSGVSDRFPGENLKSLPIAIWGKVVCSDQQPKDRDRIEILRPLTIDPREARRQLAMMGDFMGGAGRQSG